MALAGGIAGALLAWWSFQVLLAWLFSSLPGTIPQLRIDAHPNLTVMWFALGLTVTTALVFGMVPALQASKQDVHTVMKQDGTDSGGRIGSRWRFRATARGGWLRSTLIGIQVAVCMILLISASLLLRALYAAETTDPDFHTATSRSCPSTCTGQSMTGLESRRLSAAVDGADRVASRRRGFAQASKIPLSRAAPRRVSHTR